MQPLLSSIFLLLLAGTTAGYLVPSPSGRYNVTLMTGPLTDYSRNISTGMPRALMLSVFQPATSCASTIPVPYMPNTTPIVQGTYLQKNYQIPGNFAPLFEEARLPVCSDRNGSFLDDVPILLLSPGYGIPRLYYSVIASAIASEGFTVITIDHPEDANIITYPDGHAVYNNASAPTTAAGFVPYELTRVTDTIFLIDQLSNATAVGELLPQRGPRPFPVDRIGMLGHSLGGATAVVAASRDPRVRAAIDWDGTIFESLPPSGISQPVLLVSRVNQTDYSWVADWEQLKGPKLWATVPNTTHESFSDISTLLQAAGQSTPALNDLLGTIAPAELVRIMTAYTTVWMNGAFKAKEE